MKPPQLDWDRFRDLPFPVATARELERKGRVAIRAMGRSLLAVWNGGEPRLYEDACAHLGMPLSMGTLRGNQLVCRYHGWSYSTEDGAVQEQPALRKKAPCSLRRMGALRAGGLVFGWTGDPAWTERVRARLPEDVLDGFSLFRVTFRSPFYLALFSSVDYAHFPFHTGYRPLYRLYGATRSNRHRPGTPFPCRVVTEDARVVVLRIEEAEREIRMYATASEMDDGGVNFFQTYVTPISEDETLYWECYRPRGRNVLTNWLARATFRTVTTRLLDGEDRVWQGAATPQFLRGVNIHLAENDAALGAHLRAFVLPALAGGE